LAEALDALLDRGVGDVEAALAVVAGDLAVGIALQVEVADRPAGLLLEVGHLLGAEARRRDRLAVGADLDLAVARDVHPVALGAELDLALAREHLAAEVRGA